MNPVEIYHYINDNYNGKNKTEDEINKLYEKIKEKIKKPKKFKFLEKMEILSPELQKLYYEEKN